MITLKTPRGLPVDGPEGLHEDPSPRFSAAEMRDAKSYYDRNGYVIVNAVYSRETCDEIRRLWDKEIKPYRGYMYRQATAKVETHVKNAAGWIMNPILNLQSIHPVSFPSFREFATRRILADG